MVSQLTHWFSAHHEALLWTGAMSLVAFIASLVAVPWLLAHMRADYFVGEHPPESALQAVHPALRITLRGLKNLLGAFLLAMGVVMLFTPGQGLLTILIGVALVDFPRKRRLEQKIASNPRVRRSINWMRARHGQPPLRFDESGDDRPCASAMEPQPERESNPE